MKRLQREAEMGQRNVVASQKQIDGETALHFHDFYEIEYIVSGRGDCILNGRPWPLKKGMLFFMTPLDCHSVRSRNVRLFNVMFSSNSVTDACLEPFLRLTVPKAVATDDHTHDFLVSLLNEIVRYQDDASYCAGLMDCLLRKMLHFWPIDSDGAPDNAVTKMHFYMLTHFHQPVSLEQTAAYAGLSPTYASSLFKQTMGVNYKGCLDALRFDYAKKLLLTTPATVTAVCEECGFTDVPNFIRRFKARFGVTPAQWRRDAV